MSVFIVIPVFMTLVHNYEPVKMMVPDSSGKVQSELSAGMSFAFNNAINWNGSDENSFLLITDLEYSFSRYTAKATRLFNINFDLGFTYYYDSLWNKHIDKLQAQYIYKAGNTALSHSASAFFNTHFLNSYSYAYDPLSGKTRRTRTETVFNPSILEIGCGSGYTFKQHSVINISLATARLRLLPESIKSVKGESIPVGTTGTGKIYFDYGFSLQYYLVKIFSEKTEFKGKGKMFLKGFRRDQFDMDVSNSLVIRLTKYLRVKAEFKIIYAPTVSFKPQYHNELLLGVYYKPPA